MMRSTRYLFFIICILLLSTPVLAVTFTVAASDSLPEEKVMANYICDGRDDQKEINAALHALPLEGGTVLLSSGTFFCSSHAARPPQGGYTNPVGPREDPDNIIPPANSILAGQGKGSTIIHYTGSRGVIYDWDFRGSVRIRNPNVTVRDFSVTGTGWVYVSASNARILNIIVSDTEATGLNKVQAAFMIRADNTTLADIELNNCEAFDVPSFGFLVDGVSSFAQKGKEATSLTNAKLDMTSQNISRRKITDLRFINCTAYKSPPYDAYTPRYSVWDVGFDVPERAVLDTVIFSNCTAEGFYESGFHSEVHTYIENMVFTQCTSQNNGYKDHAAWGSGWHLANGYGPGPTVLRDCVSNNNGGSGFYVDATSNYNPRAIYYLINIVDNGSPRGIFMASEGIVNIINLTPDLPPITAGSTQTPAPQNPGLDNPESYINNPDLFCKEINCIIRLINYTIRRVGSHFLDMVT